MKIPYLTLFFFFKSVQISISVINNNSKYEHLFIYLRKGTMVILQLFTYQTKPFQIII